MHTKTLTAAALAATAVYAQSSNSSMNLTSLISSNSDLSGLAQVLMAYPDVAAQIGNMTNVTLLAPSNSAVQALQASGAISNSSGDLDSLVKNLLSYHILAGEIYAENITSTPHFPTTELNNASYTNVTGGQVVECRLVDNKTVEITSGLKMVSNVTSANLNFTGGVVHIIDQVLTIPLNVSATADVANLTALLGAIAATNLTETLDTAKDITIFAPSNSAFQAIGSNNLTLTELAGILEYHVLNGTVAYSSSLSNTSVTALNGGKLNITVESDGAVFVNSARVVVPDILISGGVLHVIDSVLNPNATNSTVDATATTAVVAFSGVSSASDVPFTSGIPEATTTVTALVSTVSNVASGYSTVVAAGGASASGAPAGGSTSSKAAAMAGPTGAIGAAALFGGAAFIAGQL